MKLSIIVPCYNEEKTIEEIIKKIKNIKFIKKEIIIIDDYSTDRTKKILEKIDNHEIKVLYNELNYGKGYSVRKGIKFSSGDIIIIQDADLEYDPDDYHLILKPIMSNRADVVYGSRFTSTQEKRVLFFWHTVGNSFLTLLSNIFSNLNLTDMECGLKAFKSNILKNIKLEENRFGFEPEVTQKISKLKLRIYEVGVKYFGRTYKEGKKITWKDGFSAIRCIIKYSLFR